MQKNVTRKSQSGYYVIFFIAIFSMSCSKNVKPDLEKAKKEILLLDAQQRTFHFTKNATALVALFSKNYMSVNRGEINFPDEKKSLARFSSYFDSVDSFLKWDNIDDPVIRFSDDGSIAYVVVHKMVILEGKNNAHLDTTGYAWLTVYKKNNDGWQIDCVTSTNK